MYTQITTRCNMTCPHCLFSCIEQGEDMSYETFMAALKYQSDYSEFMVFGGGEPTIHPQFWEFLMEALCEQGITDIWLATNGSQTKLALKLAQLAKKGIIGCALSQDIWHDPIEQEVMEAFGVNEPKQPRGYSGEPSVDQREVRCVEKNVIPMGRAIINNLANGADKHSTHCDCGQIIKPNGNINLCSCPGSPAIGDVFEGVKDIWQNVPHECYKSDEVQDFYREETEQL